ncbi:MAG: HD domain-containing phosphohydrolase [Thermodesulfobacteriota bacterium]
MKDKDHITDLEAQLRRLKAELAEKESELRTLRSELGEAKGRERDLEDTRRSMLYMLEDLNESTSNIEKAKQEWEETFDAVDDLISIHDKEYTVIRGNRAVFEKLGKEPREIIGKKCYNLFHGTEEPWHECPHTSTIESQTPATEEVEDPHMGGTFLVSTYPVFDKEGQFYASVHIAKDITERKKAEQDLKREMEVTTNLLAISTATARTTSVDVLMEKVSVVVNSVMESDSTLTYIRERGGFQPQYSYGLENEQKSFFKTEPLDEKNPFVQKALEEKMPVIETFKTQDSTFREKKVTTNFESGTFNIELFPWIKEIKTLVIIPLTGREGVLGLLVCIYCKSKPEIGGRGQELTAGISHQITTAIEEAMLYQESVKKTMDLSRKMETIEVMHEIDKSILSTLDRREVLEITIKMISRLLPCDRAIIGLVDRERQGFTCEAGFGVSFLSEGAFIPFGDTSAAEVVRTERPQYVADLTKVSEILPVERGIMEEGYLSFVRTPLIVKGEVVGVLTVGARRAAAYAPDDLSTLQKTADQIGVALENTRLMEDLRRLMVGTIESLTSAIDAKSPWTKGHSERVTLYALRIGRKLGLEAGELDDLEFAGLLHDIGKLATYETILDKPGGLSEEEINMIRQHPAKGVEILSPIKQFGKVIPAIKNHHEFYDGKGYPEGLKGEDIPLMARILAVADTVDAMHSDRPYRKGKSIEEVVGELKRCSGSQFDPAIVEAFLKTLEEEGVDR